MSSNDSRQTSALEAIAERMTWIAFLLFMLMCVQCSHRPPRVEAATPTKESPP